MKRERDFVELYVKVIPTVAKSLYWYDKMKKIGG